MIKSGFNLGVVLLLFGQLLAQIISGFSNEAIPANLLLTGLGFIIAIVLISCNKRLRFPKIKLNDAVYLFLLVSFFISAYLYGKGSSSSQKQISVLYLILLPNAILYILSLSVKTVDIYKLGLVARRLAYISICFAFLLFMIGSTHHVEGSTRLSIDGVGNTIWFGRYLGLLVVVLVVTNSHNKNITTIIFSLISIYLMVSAGARGPFVAMIAAMVFAKFNIPNKYLLLGLLGIILLPYFIELTDISQYLLNRGDFSGFSRINLVITSLELIQINPITGIGFGNFGSYSYAYDDSVNFYPHNILVEILVECGLFSFIIFIFLISRALYLGNSSVFITTVFIYTFVNALFSGDVTGNSTLFSSMFLISILTEKILINENKFRYFK